MTKALQFSLPTAAWRRLVGGIAAGLALLAGPAARAQAPAWGTVTSVTNAATPAGSGVVPLASTTDANGNILTIGTFQGTVSFGSISLTSNGAVDGFIAKFNPASASYTWVQAVGGVGDETVTAITTSGNNVYVTGTFTSTALTLGSTTFTRPTPFDNDVFLAKLTDNGSTVAYNWAQQLSGNGAGVSAEALTVSGSTIYMGGAYAARTLTIGSTTLTNYTSAGAFQYDAYLAKFTDGASSPSFVWAQNMGGTGNEVVMGVGAVGSSVYVVGNFTSSTARFGSYTINPNGRNDVFYAKLNDTGFLSLFTWAVAFGGSGDDLIRDVIMDGSNAFVAGNFDGTNSFYGNNISSLTSAGSGTYNAFVAKLADNGSTGVGVWAESLGGNQIETGNQIAKSGSNIYLTGRFVAPSLTYNGATINNIGNVTGTSDIYVVRMVDYGTAVSPRWLQTAGGTGNDSGLALAISGTTVWNAGTVAPPALFSSQTVTGTGTGFTMYQASLTDPSIALAPTITSFTPTSGLIGTSITITGTNLNNLISVGVNGATTTTFTTGGGGTSVTFTLPNSATTGPVQVLTNNGFAVSSTNFTPTGGSATTVYTVAQPSITTCAGIFYSSNAGVGTYSNGENYSTLITPSTPGAKMRLDFTARAFSMENCCDYLTIYDGPNASSPVMGQYNGSTVRPSIFTATNATGQLYVTFTSDGSVSGVGFGADMSCVLPPTPNIFTISPNPATVGTLVTVTGTNFTGATAVTLNGQTVTGFVVNSGGTGLAFTVPNGATSGPITITTSLGTGTSGANILTVPSGPTITGISPSSAAVGSTVTLTGSNFTGTTAVSLNGQAITGFTVNGAGTTLTLTIPANATAGTFSATTSNGTGTSTGSFCPLYTPTTTSASRCGTGSVNLTAAGAPTASGVSYNFYTSATGGTALSGVSGNSFATPSLSGTTTYYVAIATGTGANACEGPRTAVTATINPVPNVSVAATGPTTFCTGGSVTLQASGANSYLWSNGSTASSITVTQNGNYSVVGTNTVGTCTATSNTVAVTVNPAPSATISANGSTTLCPGGSVVLTASAGTSYLWSNGLTTPSITVSAAGSYTVQVSNGTCTATSAATTVTTGSAPTASITATGNTTLCPGGSVVLTASPGTSYLWSTGATTQSITVSQGGSYSVAVTNGNCTGNSPATTVSISAPAVASITSNGPTTICQGSNVVLTANGTAGSTFLWSTGATTPTITVTQGGSYTVTATNTAGCTATSAATTVSINAAAIASITTSGPTTFCQGSNVVLTANGTAGSTFLWSNGQTTPTITVTQGGSYTVTATNTSNCQATSTATVVTVNAAPATPVVVLGSNASTAVSNAATGNQWYFNGMLVPGATGPSYTVTTPAQQGSYTVVTTNATGCASTVSNAVTLMLLGTAPAAVAAQVQVYPNPTQGAFTVTLPTHSTRTTQVQVLNSLGQTVRVVVVPATVTSAALDLTGLARGVYAVRVQLGTDAVMKRVVLN